VTVLVNEALAFLREELGGTWDELGAEDRRAAELAVRDATDLLARRLLGEPVDEELLEVGVQLREWSFAGGSYARRAVLRTVRRWAGLVGVLLLVLVEGVFRGLVESDSAVDELLRGLSRDERD
jgi:hypothetical protein